MTHIYSYGKNKQKIYDFVNLIFPQVTIVTSEKIKNVLYLHKHIFVTYIPNINYVVFKMK